jgi:hypothetical protein
VKNYREENVHEPYQGVRRARLVEAPHVDREAATPQRLEEARQAGIPEAPFADFEIYESAAGRYVFRDRASGTEYRRALEFDPLGAGDTLAARSIACFTIDAGTVCTSCAGEARAASRRAACTTEPTVAGG